MSQKVHNKAIKNILQNAVQSAMPKDVIPMSFKLSQASFDNEDWQFEVKWDGFRILSYCNGADISLRSRNNKSFDKRFNMIGSELESLRLNAVFDGEIVLLKENGCSDFDGLLSGNTGCLVYYVFDMLWYDGYSLMDLPLHQRRTLLKSILPKSDVVRFSDHIETNGTDLFELAKKNNIEGIVAKNKHSHYLPGIRTSQWLKIKTTQVAEGVVAGLLLDQEKEGSGFSSLIVGVKENKNYKYIGLVEAGISRTAFREILSNGKPSIKSIFTPVPNVNKQLPFRNKIKKPEVIWLEPTLKCEVKYLELDKFGMMRHASFKGLR